MIILIIIIKKLDTGLYGNVYDFSVDYSSVEIDKIKDIHTYLMKKQQHCINEQ